MFARTCSECGWIKWSKDFYTTSHGNICRKCSLEKMRRWAIDHPEVAHRASTNRKVIGWYNITLSEHSRVRALLYFRQRGRCAICGAPFPLPRLALDHCHATGRLRGLLCTACNYAIGALKDNPDHLRRAAEYLTEI